SGSAEGDSKAGPPAVKWPADGWQVKADVIVKDVPYTVAPHTKNDVIEWLWGGVPSPFKTDTWRRSMEIRPSEHSVTHHMCVRMRPHADDVKYNELIWEDKARDNDGSVFAEGSGTGQAGQLVSNGPIIGCYVPGHAFDDYRLYNSA